MFGIFGGSGNRFDPSRDRFPDINVERVAKRLRLAKRGEEDGENGIPSADRTTFTKAELDAIAEVEALRKEALNNFDDELRSYKSRISEARSDTSSIKLKIADAAHGLERLENEYGNHLQTALVRVQESQKKLDAFRSRQGVIGPPEKRSNVILTASFVAFMLLLESILNAQFFAKRNELGLVGGVLQAGMISALNIAIGYLAGLYARHKNLKGFSSKLLGFGVVLFWLALASTFNLAVAHFRDALEANPWNESLQLAVTNLIAGPTELASLDSWMLFLIGSLVTLSSFLKAYHSADPLPGYNALWDSVERSVEDYAEKYGQAHDILDETFGELVQDLRAEVEKRRANLRSAVDALDSRGSMLDGLRVFLRTTNGAANQLLAVYREANIASRKDQPPRYFDETFAFGGADLTDRKLEDLNVGFVEVEIGKMETLVNLGVEKLTRAQKRSLQAFPTVQDIKAGRIERREEDEQFRFSNSIEELDRMFPSEPQNVLAVSVPEELNGSESEAVSQPQRSSGVKRTSQRKAPSSKKTAKKKTDVSVVRTESEDTTPALEGGDLFSISPDEGREKS